MTITHSSTRIVALTLGVAAVVAVAFSVALAAPAHAAGVCPGTTFSTNLKVGSSGAGVMALQQFLNMDPDTMVASSGAGSPGNETSYFGGLTKAAVNKFQEKYAAEILTPLGLSTPTGNFFGGSRAEANAVCSGSMTTSTGGTTSSTTGAPGTAAGTAVVSAAAQPANSIAPQGASRVPFTAFTVTANGAPVTLNSVSVVRQGPSNDTDFAGVILVNAATGAQLGTSRILDANHSATIGTPVTIPAGTSMTFWVEGNIASISNPTNGIPGSGDVASFAVTAINTSSTVSGSLPIVGASNTINTALTIGTATIQTSSFDPNNAATQPIGTTGYRFTGIRLQAGSAEDVTLHTITWYQSGSASGIQNVVSVVNGTSYPTTLDSSGRYYTTVFPSGIVIPKGQQVDVYVQGDLGANTLPNTYAEFDVYRNTDIYLTGNTYGFGITPTLTSTGGTCNGNASSAGVYCSASSHTTLFIGGSSTPFLQGSTLSITGGTFSTIQNATSVGAQNIAINSPNQPLGGFQTNLTGEAIQVQSLVVNFTTSTSTPALQNVSINSNASINSNGSVVSGPYNAVCGGSTYTASNITYCGTGSGSATQKVTFTGAVTFPTGTNTYTLEGQVPTGATNSETIIADTDPTSGWTNVTGQTSGNTVSIGVTDFSMNTMTVQAATLAVSNGTTPTSQAVVAGGSNIQFATIQLDASQSGENVRLSSIPMTLTTTAGGVPANLSNCQLWNGSTALNTGSYVVNSANITGSVSPYSATFSFNNSLTIPKGTVLSLGLTCNLSGSAGTSQTYAWAPTTGVTATGATSGSTVTISSIGGSAPVMTVSTGATLAVTTDPSSPSYSLIAGGTTGVTMSVIKFHATNEGIDLQKVGLQLTNAASSTAADVTQAYLYAGNNVLTSGGTAVAPGTLLGTLVFTGSNFTATSTLSQVVQLPVNQDATLVVKADLAAIGTNQAGNEGDLVAIDYLNSQGTGANSGKTVNAGSSNFSGGTSAGVRTFKTTPTAAAGPSVAANPVGTSVALKKFSITAGTSNGIGLYQLQIAIATSGAQATNLQLHAYTDSGYSQPANVPGATGGQFGVTDANYGSDAALISSPILSFQQTGSNVFEIGAGQTIYFTLTGNVTQTGNNSNGTVFATLNGDTKYPSVSGTRPFMTQASAVSPGNFIWSPNATTTVVSTSNDWTNGYGVSGLPSTGL